MKNIDRKTLAKMLGSEGGKTTARRHGSEQLAAWGKKGAQMREAKKHDVNRV